MAGFKNFLRQVLINNVVFMVMFLIYPVLFFMSANPTTYLPEQYAAAVLCLAGVALTASAAIELLFYIFNNKSFFSSRAKRILYVLAAFAIGYSPLRGATYILIPLDIMFDAIIASVLLFALFLDKKRPPIVNVLAVFLSFTCLFLYVSAIYEGHWKENRYSNVLDSSQEIEGIQFVSRPNVYYFYMESYHGREAMTELYNYDNAEFLGYLHKNKFRVYDNTYSNYRYTFASLTGTFQMKHHYYIFERDSLDLDLSAKQILSGEKHNSVLTAFKNNGYEVNYYLHSDYFFKRAHGVRFFNVKYNPWAALNPFFIWRFWDTWTADRATYISDMITMIEEAHKSSAPQFFFISSGSEALGMIDHTPGSFHRLPQEIRENTKSTDFNKHPWKFYDYFISLYVDRVKAQNALFEKVLDRIITGDPNAVIILLGDHGAHRYRGISTEDMRDENIAPRDLANDFFNVLLAVRMPPGLTLPDADVISNVNVFRYVLSSLSGTTSLTDNKEEDVSLTTSTIFVRDGKPLDDPEPIILREYRRHKLGIDE